MYIFCSLYDAYSDEMGILDFGRSQNGSGMASQSQVRVHIDMHKKAKYKFPTILTYVIDDTSLHALATCHTVSGCISF